MKQADSCVMHIYKLHKEDQKPDQPFIRKTPGQRLFQA